MMTESAKYVGGEIKHTKTDSLPLLFRYGTRSSRGVTSLLVLMMMMIGLCSSCSSAGTKKPETATPEAEKAEGLKKYHIEHLLEPLDKSGVDEICKGLSASTVVVETFSEWELLFAHLKATFNSSSSTIWLDAEFDAKKDAFVWKSSGAELELDFPAWWDGFPIFSKGSCVYAFIGTHITNTVNNSWANGDCTHLTMDIVCEF